MQDKFFEISRTNMVQNQIITNKVVSENIINAFLTIEKEKFIPESHYSLVYSDSSIEIKKNRFLMKTFIFAKMLEYSGIEKSDSVLVLGCLSGYSVAIISKLAGYVFGVEDDSTMVKNANNILTQMGFLNCSISNSKLSMGLKKNAPYDKIIIEGAVEFLPVQITDQLRDEGKIFAIFKKRDSLIGEFMVGFKKNNQVSYRTLFNANSDSLSDFLI